MSDVATRCVWAPLDSDGTHCVCWWKGGHCCACGVAHNDGRITERTDDK